MPRWDALRLSDAISYFFAPKTNISKNYISPFEFWDSKNCQNDRMQKLWLFFIEFLHPTFYAKVMAILPGHKVFIKNYAYYFF
jgi:hypothetical protein